MKRRWDEKGLCRQQPVRGGGYRWRRTQNKGIPCRCREETMGAPPLLSGYPTASRNWETHDSPWLWWEIMGEYPPDRLSCQEDRGGSSSRQAPRPIGGDMRKGSNRQLQILHPSSQTSAHKSLWAVQRAKALFTPRLKPRRKMGMRSGALSQNEKTLSLALAKCWSDPFCGSTLDLDKLCKVNKIKNSSAMSRVSRDFRFSRFSARRISERSATVDKRFID